MGLKLLSPQGGGGVEGGSERGLREREKRGKHKKRNEKPSIARRGGDQPRVGGGGGGGPVQKLARKLKTKRREMDTIRTGSCCLEGDLW